MPEEIKKRKPRTSSAVKNRYNKKTYDRIGIAVPKQLGADFRAKCAECGVSVSSVLQKAMILFLKS